MNLFEESISYDFIEVCIFYESLLFSIQTFFQASFPATSAQEKKSVGQTIKLHKIIRKRENSEIDTNEDKLKKCKCDIVPETPVQRKFPGPAGLLPDHYKNNNKKPISEIIQSESNALVSYFCYNKSSLIKDIL